MGFASLGSGSRGNGTVVSIGSQVLLVDCGFTLKQAEQRLTRLGLSGGDINAILVTHEHADHASGVGPLAHRYRIPVYGSYGTLKNVRRQAPELASAHAFDGDLPFEIEDVKVNPVCVPHDAREPTQFVLSDGADRIGVLSDLGHVTQHVTDQFAACDYLLLEANHDRQMLMSGSYPPNLKRRVGADFGHLSNEQAAHLLGRVAHADLHVVIGHVSEQNNHPERLREVFDPLVEAVAALTFATQDEGFEWVGERPLTRQISFDQVM